MDIRIKVHNNLLKLRSIERTLKSTKFEACIQMLEEDVLHQLVNDLDSEGLIKYVDQMYEEGVCQLSIRELRKKASRLGIPYFAHYNRETLIGVINDAEKIERASVEMPLVRQG